MKKIRIIIFFIAIIQNYAFAQPLGEKDFVIEAHMGYPNLSYFKSNIQSLTHFNGTLNNDSEVFRSIGQFIVNADFFLTDMLSLSVGANYGYYYYYQEIEESIYDGSTGQYTVNTYFAEKQTHRFRIYLGPNFHLLRTDRLDSYFGIKAGIKRTNIITNDNFPNNSSYFGFNDTEIEFPVGLRLCYGMRYFVTHNLAISTEIGLGGPAITFGITYKLTDN